VDSAPSTPPRPHSDQQRATCVRGHGGRVLRPRLGNPLPSAHFYLLEAASALHLQGAPSEPGSTNQRNPKNPGSGG
jgi:hypothetical protein